MVSVPHNSITAPNLGMPHSFLTEHVLDQLDDLRWPAVKSSYLGNISNTLIIKNFYSYKILLSSLI